MYGVVTSSVVTLLFSTLVKMDQSQFVVTSYEIVNYFKNCFGRFFVLPILIHTRIRVYFLSSKCLQKNEKTS